MPQENAALSHQDLMKKVVPLILAAGYGRRMAPLTNRVPKPLLPFLNVPIIAYNLSLLARAGFKRVGVNASHLADQLEPVVRSLCAGFGLALTFVREDEPLGSGGGLYNLIEANGG